MKKTILFILLLSFSVNLNAQTSLSAGDVAIVAFNSDGTDDFAFLLLRQIEENTVIKFTENGWLSSNAFRSGEGTITFTASQSYKAGTVLIYDADDVGSEFSVSGTFALSTSGDQIIVYQGADLSPTMIFAINFDGAAVWQADATNTNTSALPQGLTNGVNAIAITETDNAIYDEGITNGTPANVLADIVVNANWTGDNSNPFTMPTTYYILYFQFLVDPNTSNIDLDSARVSFETSEQAIAKVFYGETVLADDDSVDLAFTDSVFSTLISSLTEETQYYYFVRSTADDDSEVIYSDTLSFSTLADTLSFDQTPISLNITDSTFDVRWTASHLASAKIAYGTSEPLNDTLVVPENSLTDTATVVNLDEATRYYYTVTLNRQSNSELVISNLDSIQTTSDTVLFVIDPVSFNVTDTTADIRWEASHEATAQIVYGTTTAYGDTLDVPSVALSDTATIINLTANTEYHFSVILYKDSELDTNQSIDYTFTTTDIGSLPTSGLFFSEYIEGSSNNKALEIHNRTGETIDLENYVVEQYNGGSATVTTTLIFQAGTILENDSSYVISNSSAGAEIAAASDTTSGVTSFNGDDAIALRLRNYADNSIAIYMDIIGVIGEDPGSSWTGNSVSTANQTLRRKNGILTGITTNPASFDPSVEWNSYAIDSFDNLGNHKADFDTLNVVSILNDNYLIANDSIFYEAFQMTLDGNDVQIDSVIFGQNGSSDMSALDSAILLYNSNPIDTVDSFTGDLIQFFANISTQNFTAASDTLSVLLKFHTINQNENHQMRITSADRIVGSLEDLAVGSFPLDGRTLSYDYLYSVSSVSFGSPDVSAGALAYMGYFSLATANTMQSIRINNRVISGTVDATDIDSVYIYVTNNTSDPSGTTPTADEDFIDDSNGGTANLTLGVASTNGNYFHIAYKLTPGRDASHDLGVEIDTMSFANPMELDGSFPYKILADKALPVQFAPISYAITNKAIELSIRTYSEVNAFFMEIERSTLSTGLSEIVGRLELNGSASQGKDYTFSDEDLVVGEEYRYQVFVNGNEAGPAITLEFLPNKFSISKAYPNPFNPITRIDYVIPEAANVQVQIFNLLGQRVYSEQVNKSRAGAFFFEWNTKNNSNRQVSNGLYFISMKLKGLKSGKVNKLIQKVILVK